MSLDDYKRVYERYGNTGDEFRNIGDGVIQAGAYADEGKPDVQIEMMVAQDQESMAEEVMDSLNFCRSFDSQGVVKIVEALAGMDDTEAQETATSNILGLAPVSKEEQVAHLAKRGALIAKVIDKLLAEIAESEKGAVAGGGA